jgi:PIN domain nuclease of toxin-antitoxin system
VSDAEIVVDASAVLALLLDEGFKHFDPERVVGATISAVNFSEVLAKLCEGGLTEDEADEAVSALDFRILAFDQNQARATAWLRQSTRQAGLSLADRACLALGVRLQCPVVTADRAWATLDINADIVLVR